MSAHPVTTRTARAEHLGGDRPVFDAPVLDRRPGRVGSGLVVLAGEGHPIRTYLYGILLALAAIASLSIVTGLLLTRVLLHIPGVASADESVVRFLVRHRTTGLTDASLIGSMMAGGVVLPVIAALAALTAALARAWRLAAFLAFALAVESGSYRITTFAVHRHRPEVHRLERLPVDASYPSGHTAASIAVYCGLALLLTSRIRNLTARIVIWTVAALIPVFVAGSRMYRGMHHPTDILGGALIGICALLAVVTITRAAGSAKR
jgi:undecaprenyl-diphosphatase